MDGQTGDIAWQLQITWRSGHSYYGLPNANADPSVCLYPRAARREGRTGASKVAYIIESDGSVTGATLVQSSGWKDLDDTAVACASARHYPPITAGGKPARLQWTAAFDWRFAS